MGKTFCTIITRDFLPYAFNLFDSVVVYDENIELNIFIADREYVDDASHSNNNINIFGCKDLCEDGLGNRLKNKYRSESMDKFRWTMKPVFINFLLTKRNYNKVIFVDPDIQFYNDYNFLFEELDHVDVLLNPHWRSSDPYADPRNFHDNLNDGLFNGGFVGVNKNGIQQMEWWAMVCEYACEKDRIKGLFDDQGYLHLLPVYYNNIGIVKHKGCDVAYWNRVECKREKQRDGKILINNEYPIIFVHFTPSTVKGILRGHDQELFPYLKKYADGLKNYNPDIDIILKYQRIIAEKKAEKRSIARFISKFYNKGSIKLKAIFRIKTKDEKKHLYTVN